MRDTINLRAKWVRQQSTCVVACSWHLYERQFQIFYDDGVDSPIHVHAHYFQMDGWYILLHYWEIETVFEQEMDPSCHRVGHIHNNYTTTHTHTYCSFYVMHNDWNSSCNLIRAHHSEYVKVRACTCHVFVWYVSWQTCSIFEDYRVFTLLVVASFQILIEQMKALLKY